MSTGIVVSNGTSAAKGRAGRNPVEHVARLGRSRTGRLALTGGGAALALALMALTARHLAESSWPLSRGHPGLLVAVGLLFLTAYALKVYAWQRLFAADERPPRIALAAANGAGAVMGLAFPGRFDDAIRIAIVRRYPGCPASVRTLGLSLAMLGLIDTAALAPLAFAAAAFPGHSIGMRAGLAVVGGAGIGAAALIVALPRMAASRRILRFRLGRWLKPRTTSPRDALRAWMLVSAYWPIRAVALLLLFGTLGIGFSFPLAALFLCAGAAAGALPIGPASAATQAGAGAAALMASGVGASQAVGAAIVGQALGVMCGGAIFLFAVAWRTRPQLLSRLVPNRAVV
jgi:uncharacterized membrane protein YbhN (UPF0104 family)